MHSALLAARHVVDADIAVVAQGPGNLGTGTRWGFSGVAAGEAVNAAAVLRGHPVAALRVSGADPRERHRGVSHHSLTAYGRVRAGAGGRRRPGLRRADRRTRRRARRARRAGADAGRRSWWTPTAAGTAPCTCRWTASMPALSVPGAAVDDGPQPGRGPGGVPRRGRRRAARRRAAAPARSTTAPERRDPCLRATAGADRMITAEVSSGRRPGRRRRSGSRPGRSPRRRRGRRRPGAAGSPAGGGRRPSCPRCPGPSRG